MPSIKMLCPNCDTKLRLTLEDDEDVECPACGETFTPEVVEKPRQSKKAGGKKEVEASSKQYRRKAPSRSKMPLIIGISVGTVLVAGVIVALVIGLGGSKEKLQAKNSLSTVSTSPTRKPPSPPQSVPTRPSKVESPTVQPTPTPPDMPPDDVPPPPMPPEVQPQQPVIMQPVRPRAGDDVFDRVAKFKPMGPLPELPPLPPIERRPLLVLDPGGHTAFVKHVFFTPAGTRVISVSDDKSIRWWDVASGEPLQTVRLPAGPDIEGTPFGAAMSSDGVRLAVGGFPFQRGKLGIPVYILSVETGELLDAILGASDTIRALDFSPDGKQIAVGCLDGTVQVYDFTTKKWGFQVAAHTKMLKHVKFHPNKALLASMSYDQEVKIWDLTKKVPVAEIPLK